MPIKKINVFEQIGRATWGILSGLRSLIEFNGEVARAIWNSIRHPGRIRWKDVRLYLSTCGVDGFPVTVLICLLMGIILGYQSAVQIEKYGANNLLPVLVGCVIVRELGPLMVAVVATGRSGSAFAAEIGTMKISEELDAMSTMGLDVSRFLVMPKLMAMLVSVPLLTVFGDAFGVFGGYLIGKTQLGLTLDTYMRVTQEWVALKYFMEGFIKSFVFAYVITVVGCWRGFETGNDAIAVGKSTTSAVVISILSIIISDAVMTKIFTDLYNAGVF